MALTDFDLKVITSGPIQIISILAIKMQSYPIWWLDNNPEIINNELKIIKEEEIKVQSKG